MYHKLTLKVNEKFIFIQNNIDRILKESPFKMNYIIEKSGIKKPTFFRKLREKKFTPEKLLEIAKGVEVKEWHNETKEEILESFKKAEEDFKNGKRIPGDVFMSRLNQRLAKYREEEVSGS